MRAPSFPNPVAPRGPIYESYCLRMQFKSDGKFNPNVWCDVTVTKEDENYDRLRFKYYLHPSEA